MLSLFLFCFSGVAVDPPKPYGPLPSASQLRYHKEELSAFIHFTVNTYTGQEWGTGREDPDVFRPTALDTDQWVSSLKDAGFKRVIMIAKHHDGFVLYKTQYTSHQVNESKTFQETSKKLGQSGDVWLELSKSCTKYDLDMGIYLSPWDMNSPFYGHDEQYNEYYMNQLTELMGSGKYGNNGKFVQVWMDSAKGAGSPKQKYYFQKWFDLIEKLQPGSVVTSAYASSVRLIGNERGRAGDTCWMKVNSTYMREMFDNDKSTSGIYENRGDPDGDIWSVGECDTSMATNGWFWRESGRAKSIKDLAGIYYTSVARGAPLLLNVPPTKEGKFGADFVAVLKEFGEVYRNSFRDNLAFLPGVKATASNVRGGSSEFAAENVLNDDDTKYWTMDDDRTTGTLTIDLGKEMLFDTVMIREHIELGQRIIHHKVEVRVDGVWQLWANSHTIGAKRLLRDLPVVSDGVRITITESYAVPCITKIGLFKMAGAFSLGDGMPIGLTEVNYKNLTKTGGWTEEQGTYTSSLRGAGLESTFTGTKAYLLGTVDKNWGSVRVFIDDVFVANVSFEGKEHAQRVLLWTSADLSVDTHKMRIECVGDGKVGVRAFYFLCNDGVGMFELSAPEYTVKRGDQIVCTVRRIGGTKTTVRVMFSTSPDTGVSGLDFNAKGSDLVFNEGETTKTVAVQTVKGNRPDGLQFIVLCGSPTGKAIIGKNDKASVTIKNSNDDENAPAARPEIEIIQ